MKTLKLSGKMKTIAINPLQRERDEVREYLVKRYPADHHHIMIDSIHRHGLVQVVLFVVETSSTYHRRVAIIKDGRIDNDIVADQE